MATAIIKISTPEGADPIELFKDMCDEAWGSNRSLRDVIENSKYEYDYADEPAREEVEV
jgi:hypothetical protein